MKRVILLASVFIVLFALFFFLYQTQKPGGNNRYFNTYISNYYLCNKNIGWWGA